jgi:thiamine kinase-like enzyme
MVNSSFPACTEDLTSEWLTQTLHRCGIPEDVKVTSFTIGPVSDPGQTSDVSRIELEYNRENSEAPCSLIGKFPSKYEQARMLALTLNTYLKEVRFFQHMAERAGDLVPKCYAAEINPDNGDFILLIEDLADLRMGEMFVSKPEDLYLMLQKIAPLHARWWRHPDLPEFDWIPQPGEKTWKPWADQLKMVLSAVLPMIKQQYGKYTSGYVWSVLEKWLEIWDELSDYTPGPYTLCHCDFHYLQCFFPTKNKDRFAIIDWQVITIYSAAIDVARALLSSSPEDRRQHEKSLVELYHKTLVESGVQDYTLERLWEEIRYNSLWTFYVYMVAIAQTDNEIFKAYAEKKGVDPYEALLGWAGSAIDDWKVEDSLNRLLEDARAEKVTS